jgi:protein-L-isoaspartate(D-aspartate) O-methyltransferase
MRTRQRRADWPLKNVVLSAPAAASRILVQGVVVVQRGDSMDNLAGMRRWFAEDLRLRGPVRRNMDIVEAFAAVPRERFMGPGPWQVRPDVRVDEMFATPDDAPHWLCHDVLVAIDAARGLNNGLPSFWAHNLDYLDLRRGERVLQVGVGTGYYAAILAELVGPQGRVVAVEHDAGLAAHAKINTAAWRQVEVVAGDGRDHDPGTVDAVVVFAGSTHPAPLWLDRLAEDGRLLMPLTGTNGWGFILCAIRRGETFAADSIGGVGIFPCLGGRDEAAAERLQTLLAGLPPRRVPISALHRGAAPDVGAVWYHGPGFWLERAASPS